MLMKNLVSRGKHSELVLLCFGVILALLVGFLDYLTGNSILFAVLYLLPVTLVAWFFGGVSVALMSSLCAVIWFVADVASGSFYAHDSTAIGETFAALFLFMIVGYSITVIKKIW
jgi:hypothetical protein